MPEDSKRFATRTRAWYRPMTSRSSTETHRVSTPLELLFDLCFVVAVGQAGAELHHALTSGHIGGGVFNFGLVFFAIWWGWLNFSWFASAFDTDDVPYRIATLVQIAGGLVVAAGVTQAFAGDFTIMVIGYVLMRLAMVSQWLRAAYGAPDHRKTALRYAAGVTVVQIFWVLRLFLPHSLAIPAFFVLFVAELAVPFFAEIAGGTPWHSHHISERYGLFTLIVLGESVLGATTAIKEGMAENAHIGALATLAGAGLLIVFSMWWLYFDRPGHRRISDAHNFAKVASWGYGHYLIFASAAAVGTGLEVAVDHTTHASDLSSLASGMTITVPVAVFLLSVWLLHIGPTNECRPIAIGFPVASVLVLAASFTPAPVSVTAVVAVALVTTTVVASRDHRS
jgi:low temperature requirement protein LtrA